jgi:hypothetical protein
MTRFPPPPPPPPPSAPQPQPEPQRVAATAGALIEALSSVDPSTKIVILVTWKGRKKIAHVDTGSLTIGDSVPVDDLVEIDPTIVFRVEVKGTMN